MAQSSSAASLILGLLIFTSVISMGNGCELAVIGGGCPNRQECIETCRPCYRGIGEVHAYCRTAGGGIILIDECVCCIEKGAPCNPLGPLQCPRPWPPMPTIALNHTQTHNTTL